MGSYAGTYAGMEEEEAPVEVGFWSWWFGSLPALPRLLLGLSYGWGLLWAVVLAVAVNIDLIRHSVLLWLASGLLAIPVELIPACLYYAGLTLTWMMWQRRDWLPRWWGWVIKLALTIGLALAVDAGAMLVERALLGALMALGVDTTCTQWALFHPGW
jgi:hypothetical protein